MKPELAELAGHLNKRMIPSLIMYSLFDMLKAFMIGHKVFIPIFFIHMFTFAMHPFWSWLLIIKFDMGLTGVAIARLLEEFCNFSIALGIIYGKKIFESSLVQI